jgi:hypothetical protein
LRLYGVKCIVEAAIELSEFPSLPNPNRNALNSPHPQSLISPVPPSLDLDSSLSVASPNPNKSPHFILTTPTIAQFHTQHGRKLPPRINRCSPPPTNRLPTLLARIRLRRRSWQPSPNLHYTQILERDFRQCSRTRSALLPSPFLVPCPISLFSSSSPHT